MDDHRYALAWRQAVSTFNSTGDLEPSLDLLDERCVWHGLAGGDDADGRDEVRRRWEAARQDGWDRQDVLVAASTDELGVVLAANRGRSRWRDAALILLWDDGRVVEAWSLQATEATSSPPQLSRQVVDAWLDGAAAFNELGDLEPLFSLMAEDCVQHLVTREAENRGRAAMRTAWESARRTTGWDRTEHLAIGGTDRIMASLYRTRRNDGWRTSAWVMRTEGGKVTEMWSVAGSAVVPAVR